MCLSEVTSRLKRVTAQTGLYIIRAGEEGKCMYFIGSTPQHTIGSGLKLGEELARGIVRSKCLRVVVDGVEVTLLGTGDYFGEVALVSRADHKRTADVTALCPCELFELSREDVYAVTQQFPILQVHNASLAVSAFPLLPSDSSSVLLTLLSLYRTAQDVLDEDVETLMILSYS